MEFNNMRLLLITLTLVISIHAVASRLPPGAGPRSQPEQSPSPQPSPSEELIISYAQYLPSTADPFAQLKAQQSQTPDEPSDADLGLGKSSPAKPANQDLPVNNICSDTDHPALCLSQLGQMGKLNLNTALDKAVQVGDEVAEEAVKEIKKVKSKPDNSGFVKSKVKQCLNGYETVLESYQKAKEAMAQKDRGTVDIQLSAAITFIDDCETEFKEKNIPSPFAEIAKKLTEMTSNTLAISQQIAN